MIRLGFDIGSNSVGSAWIDQKKREITTGVSIFPAGVDESDDKRGDPKNAKRRMARRTRITLARRSRRKHHLHIHLINAGLLPDDEASFKALLASTDPWDLRRRGLDEALSPHEFGRVLLHLSQRRGALGLTLPDPDEEDADVGDDGKVKAAIGEVRAKMLKRNARTFGEFMAMVRDERVNAIDTNDRRRPSARNGPREWRTGIRNKAANYEHCADRAMIRDEFDKLWTNQRECGGETAPILTDQLRLELDDERGDDEWLHKGFLFGQRRQSWDLGTLGRCTLEPTERCVPHADMHASRYRVVETVNNLRIREAGRPERPLTVEERDKVKAYLSGPLGVETSGKRKGQPKRTVTVTDLRKLMGTSQEGWGRATKTSRFRFNIESDEHREINTDWFSREIVHGSIGAEAWEAMPESLKEGFNRAILRFDPDVEGDAEKLEKGIMSWGGMDEIMANALVAAWRSRPRLDAKRLSMSRRAVRNLLPMMDKPWPDERSPIRYRWLTQIEARKCIAGDASFRDVTTGESLDDVTRRRYATGAKGATARDRYYMGKHVVMKDGRPIIDEETGEPLAEPPPAPLISNPVVRKAIHEVRRHLIAYMMRFGRRPDAVHVELSREARMGKKDADRLLYKNRLRNRIRNDIINGLDLEGLTSTQQSAAVDRVLLCVQQGGVCPLCGNQTVDTAITARMAAAGTGCEIAHIIPRARGGHNGLGNIVLSHTKCNRDMGRRTPREFWSDGAGFEEGMRCIEGIYAEVKRPRPSEVRSATGESLWACYFEKRDDERKAEQFKKDITDIQEMTNRQDAATKYATRQVMRYLADALYDGKGLPERGGGGGDDDCRRIFATDGMWTSRLRREWGLFFDPHESRAKDADDTERHVRREKDRGDHRHHAIDAVVIACSTSEVQLNWERRERNAPETFRTREEMEGYRRDNRIDPPAPFESLDDFRQEVERSVFGHGGIDRPICHRAVKRKLIGALHEETLFGPVPDSAGRLTGSYTATKSVLALTPNHLRMPDGWDDIEARLHQPSPNGESSRSVRRRLAAMADPPPGKSGIVRDRALRVRIRRCLQQAGIEPDKFTASQIKTAVDAGAIRQASGVPIRSVVLLRTMSDPVVIDRKRSDYHTGRRVGDPHPASKRAYVGGNNHHIEIRAGVKKDGNEVWSGRIVTAYEAAQRKLARLQALREAGVPKPSEMRELPTAERRRWRPKIAEIERAHPIVDRADSEAGRFVMSLCEGETLYMKHKHTREVGYFVVAKLDKPQSIVLVPHWDARKATKRTDADGSKVPDSNRNQFAATPGDLKALASPGQDHAVKVRVSPLGDVKIVDRD